MTALGWGAETGAADGLVGRTRREKGNDVCAPERSPDPLARRRAGRPDDASRSRALLELFEACLRSRRRPGSRTGCSSDRALPAPFPRGSPAGRCSLARFRLALASCLLARPSRCSGCRGRSALAGWSLGGLVQLWVRGLVDAGLWLGRRPPREWFFSLGGALTRLPGDPGRAGSWSGVCWSPLSSFSPRPHHPREELDMWTPSLTLLLGESLVAPIRARCSACPSPLPAAPQAQGRDGREARAARAESRYEVLPIRDGVVLRPREERLGVRTIEVTGDTIAVNGERVSPGGSGPGWVRTPKPVLRLQGLGAAGRRELFDLAREARRLRRPLPKKTARPAFLRPRESPRRRSLEPEPGSPSPLRNPRNRRSPRTARTAQLRQPGEYRRRRHRGSRRAGRGGRGRRRTGAVGGWSATSCPSEAP